MRVVVVRGGVEVGSRGLQAEFDVAFEILRRAALEVVDCGVEVVCLHSQTARV